MDKDFLEQLALKIKSHSNCSDMENIKITFFMFELGLFCRIPTEDFLFLLNKFLDIKT